MKKIFLLSFITLFLFSCFTINNNDKDEVKEKVAAGYLKTSDKKINVFDGNPANLDLWDRYIDAHNKRDLKAIASMNADSTKQFGSFKIYGPQGQKIEGTDAQLEFISAWFEAEDPKWNTFFSYTMKVDEQIGEWVISGSAVSKKVDGNEASSYDIADVYIEDGKIGGFWVYTRAPVPKE